MQAWKQGSRKCSRWSYFSLLVVLCSRSVSLVLTGNPLECVGVCTLLSILPLPVCTSLFGLSFPGPCFLLARSDALFSPAAADSFANALALAVFSLEETEQTRPPLRHQNPAGRQGQGKLASLSYAPWFDLASVAPLVDLRKLRCHKRLKKEFLNSNASSYVCILRGSFMPACVHVSSYPATLTF